MMLKRSTTKSKPNFTARLVRAGLASLAAASAVAALATGCLDRPVVKQEPTTSNVFVDQIVQTAVDKIDLLFMIDNSVSMADKQEILRDAVPILVSRLVDPICVSATTGLPTSGTYSKNKCLPDAPEFSPINDIHIGIVSSSLGAHGGDICASGAATDTLDDKAHLIGTMRPAPGGTPNPTADLNFDVTRTWNSLGFLAWDPAGNRNPGAQPGTKGEYSDPVALNTAFQDMIVATGEHGCGYEAQLESWYRFLIDPEPPATVTKLAQNPNSSPVTVRSSALALDSTGKSALLDAAGNTTCNHCDDTLLAQRKAFLRPDSLVAVVVLSDENDCSIQDAGVGWFVATSAGNTHMPKATSACDANPNDKCCRSCAQDESTPPAGCGALADDAICKQPHSGSYVTWDGNHDNLNLRCYNQRRRFGFDLLYSTQRYVDGLTQTNLPLQSNPAVSVVNPLYKASGTNAPRDKSLVFLAGIVGVPWQDIADDASLSGAGLTYLTADELLAKDRWTALLGNPNASPPVPPTDPFMNETPDERSGTNAIANVKITPDTGPTNAINGHEQKVCAKACADPTSVPSDLQYACIFKLKTPKTCQKGDQACDCSPDADGTSQTVMNANSPLCQGGATINTQVSAKGYPGARELQVLKDLGPNAIVASICPKVSDTANPDYGYNPAVGAIIERLKEALKGKCLPRPIETDAQGQVLCKVIEAQANKSACDCTLPGRAAADPNIISAVENQLNHTGNCGNMGQPACSTWCECEILQETGDALTTCQTQPNATLTTPGYCYVDKAHNPDAVSKCPSNEPQLLRFVDADPDHKTPAQGAVAFIACIGAPVNATDGGT